jgi:hypothetical protein
MTKLTAMSVGMGGGNSTVGMEGLLYEHWINNSVELETTLENELIDVPIVDEEKQTAVDWAMCLIPSHFLKCPWQWMDQK